MGFRTHNAFVRRPAALVAIALACGAAMGCQTFAPTGLGALAAKQKEQKIVKQAANDPFPSPKDVGLGGAEQTKTL
jgi:hypothetical protein